MAAEPSQSPVFKMKIPVFFYLNRRILYSRTEHNKNKNEYIFYYYYLKCKVRSVAAPKLELMAYLLRSPEQSVGLLCQKLEIINLQTQSTM